MGLFSRLFGESIEIRTGGPRTQKEQYEFSKLMDESEAEWDAEGDPRRIEKSIDRHNKKKRGNTND